MINSRAPCDRGAGALPLLSSRAVEALGPPLQAPPELKARILGMARLMRASMHVVIAPGALVAGKYRVLSLVGQGAMGSVWAALNEATGGEVALKVILCPEPERRSRLLREARALGALQHRNIVDVYDVRQTESGAPFLVMQLLNGETVAELLDRKRRVDTLTAARIGRDVARALAAAHAVAIVHRDLKPANIFLHEESGEGIIVKVLDFGMSKNLAVIATSVTAQGNSVGSPRYMSPEQVWDPGDVDHRTDIWALGVLMFELLTGLRPFDGEMHEVFAKIKKGEIPTVDRYVRHVEPGLVQVVARCMRRAREERFQSAAELAVALDRYVDADAGAAQGVMSAPADQAQAPSPVWHSSGRRAPPVEIIGPQAVAEAPEWAAGGTLRMSPAEAACVRSEGNAIRAAAAPVTPSPVQAVPDEEGQRNEAPPPPPRSGWLKDLRVQARMVAVVAATVSGTIIAGAALLALSRQSESALAERAVQQAVAEPLRALPAPEPAQPPQAAPSRSMSARPAPTRAPAAKPAATGSPSSPFSVLPNYPDRMDLR